MTRTTIKDLERAVMELNESTNSPKQPYTNGKAQAGCYHISQSYGGVSLHRMNSDSSIKDVFGCGHIPKRELLTKIFALNSRD